MEDPDRPLSLRSEEFRQFRERIVAYMRKATLEAKVHTSWINPNEKYDGAVKDFVLKLLEPRGKNRFLTDLQAFQRRVAYFGRWNALSQVLLKLTCPGVPDFYQGTELWDFSLVDPDNRRPVDFQKRQAFMADLRERLKRSGEDLVPLARELLKTAWDGRIKLYLIYRALNFRREHPDLFLKGGYIPLEGEGERKNHVCAFLRTWGHESILVGVPRLVVGLTEGMEEPPLGEKVWKGTWLPLPLEQEVQSYRNLFTGKILFVEKKEGRTALPLSQAFADFPLALLERIS
jgi:(1->4)-alpha-D-glucan 1-alpha-D-glucosylmutase